MKNDQAANDSFDVMTACVFAASLSVTLTSIAIALFEIAQLTAQ